MKLLAITFITVAITFITVAITLITAGIMLIMEVVTCVRTGASYGFPSNKFVYASARTRYIKYPSGIMIAPEGWSPQGTIIIPS